MNTQFMSDEARRYYEGGSRMIIGGVPCRVRKGANRKAPGIDFIKAAMAAGMPINAPGDDHGPGVAHELGLGRFRFIPAEKPLVNARPSKRKGFNYPLRPDLDPKVIQFRPAPLDCPAMYTAPMAGDPEELRHARYQYGEGNPKPLREYLAGVTSAAA